MRKFATWINLLIYFLVILGNTNVVLCFEADGCIAVESAGTDCCNQSLPSVPLEISSSPSNKALSEATDQCVACTDVPIPNHKHGQYIFSGQNKPLRRQPAIFSSLSHPGFALAGAASENAVFIPPPAVNSAITSLRTVVLLI